MGRKKHYHQFLSRQDQGKKSKIELSLTSTSLELLNQIEKKLNLSKSELINQIILGIIQIELSDHSPEINLEITNISSDHNPRQKPQIIVKNIQDLSSEYLEINANFDQVLTQDQANLIKQLQEKSLLVAYFQKQLNELQKNYHEIDLKFENLHRELNLKDQEIEKLTKQLNHQKFTFNDQHLTIFERESREKIEEIKLLNQEITRLKTNLQIAVNRVNLLQQELHTSQNLLTEANYSYALALEDNNNKIQKIMVLQATINQQKEFLKTQTEIDLTLQDQIQKYEAKINNLQQEISSLRSVANFGENQLNKWRRKSF